MQAWDRLEYIEGCVLTTAECVDIYRGQLGIVIDLDLWTDQVLLRISHEGPASHPIHP